MFSDPLSDMLIRLKNGYLARKKTVIIPYSKIKERLAEVLTEEGYLKRLKIKDQRLKIKDQRSKSKEIEVELLYKGKEPAMRQVRIVSKPTLRVYVDKNHLPKVLGGRGIAVISTPKGIMTVREARKAGLGGEIIWEVS